MSIGPTYYISASYHVVNLRLRKGLVLDIANHSSMMLFSHCTYFVSDEANIFQKYSKAEIKTPTPNTKSLMHDNFKICVNTLNRNKH